MKKRILLTSAAALLFAATTSVLAQDQTPDKFVFAEKSVGAYAFDKWGLGANPSTISLITPGDVIICAAPAANEDFANAIGSALSIVNSEFGNILMIKGKDSSETPGIAATGSLNTFWWAVNFVGPQSVTGSTFRATTQMKLVTANTDDTKVVKFGYVTGQNNGIGEREVVYAGDAGWFQAQIQGTIGSTEATRCRINFPGGLMDNSALYIYEIRFEKDPTEPLYNSDNETGIGMDKPLGTSITGIGDMMNDDQAFVTWGNSHIYINNAANEPVAVYSIGGQLVYKTIADKALVEIPMAKGVYVVKVGTKSTKIVL